MLMTRMSTDAPSAGMEEPADVWTVQRLLDAEERWANDPRHQLMAVVEHVPTSTLVGYSLLIVPPSLSRPVDDDKHTWQPWTERTVYWEADLAGGWVENSRGILNNYLLPRQAWDFGYYSESSQRST